MSLELRLRNIDWRGLPTLRTLLPAPPAANVGRLEKPPERKVSYPSMLKGLPVGEKLETRPLVGRPGREWLRSRYQGNHGTWSRKPRTLRSCGLCLKA